MPILKVLNTVREILLVGTISDTFWLSGFSEHQVQGLRRLQALKRLVLCTVPASLLGVAILVESTSIFVPLVALFALTSLALVIHVCSTWKLLDDVCVEYYQELEQDLPHRYLAPLRALINEQGFLLHGQVLSQDMAFIRDIRKGHFEPETMPALSP